MQALSIPEYVRFGHGDKSLNIYLCKTNLFQESSVHPLNEQSRFYEAGACDSLLSAFPLMAICLSRQNSKNESEFGVVIKLLALNLGKYIRVNIDP